MGGTGRGGARWIPPFLLLASVLALVGGLVHATSVDRPRGAPAGSGRTGGTGQASRGPSAHRPRQAAPTAPLGRMLGQMIVARFSGTTPSASLLGRIRAGEVGGVILFAENFSSGLNAARAMISGLQRAAHQGGAPPLLVMTDQEGGTVDRVTGPPVLAPSEMRTAALAFQQGRAAGRLLGSLGVNMDLAPVADVERVSGSFLGTRSFGSAPETVAAEACAFAKGIASEHVIYTLKHFPGLGRASANTDVAPVSIDVAPEEMRVDYAAYRACGRAPLAAVMISSAIYPALTGPLPAVMSPLTYQRELPDATGTSQAVTISDDLQSAAIAAQRAPARHAIDAGLDLLLYAQTEEASARAYAALLDEARSGVLSRARVKAAYRAIIALKQRAALPASR